MKATYHTNVAMDDYGAVIRTTVTSSGKAVELFLRDVAREHGGDDHDGGGGGLTVGIDTEWRAVVGEDGRRGYKLAVLQLCVGRRCLVFKIFRAGHVPGALRAFLARPGNLLAGVGVAGDVRRLSEDCGLDVAGAVVELPRAAAEALGRPELRAAGLRALAREVMGVLIDKPRAVTMSEWDAWRLSPEQVRYACIDAFVSYEVGRLLLAAAAAAGQRAQGAAMISPPVDTVAPGS